MTDADTDEPALNVDSVDQDRAGRGPRADGRGPPGDAHAHDAGALGDPGEQIDPALLDGEGSQDGEGALGIEDKKIRIGRDEPAGSRE